MILLHAPRTAPLRDYRGNVADDMVLGEAEAMTIVVGLLAVKHSGLITEAEWRAESIEVLMRSVPTEHVSALLADLLAQEVTA